MLSCENVLLRAFCDLEIPLFPQISRPVLDHNAQLHERQIPIPPSRSAVLDP